MYILQVYVSEIALVIVRTSINIQCHKDDDDDDDDDDDVQ